MKYAVSWNHDVPMQKEPVCIFHGEGNSESKCCRQEKHTIAVTSYASSINFITTFQFSVE